MPAYIGTSSPFRGLTAWRPRKTPFFSFSMLIRSNSDMRTHSSRSSRQSASHSVPAHSSSHRGCSGERVTNVTPKMVSGLVVNVPMLASEPTTGKSMCVPWERPIQLRCIALTFSGKEMLSSSSSSSSEYSVMCRNHCIMSLCTTSRPQRQQRLFLTCSLASTVSQSTHQLTGAILCSTRPRSLSIRNICWFQR